MLSAFNAAVEVLFADDHLADDGTFTSPPDDPIPVRVIRARRDEPWGEVRSPGWELHLSRAQVPTKPGEGDYVTIAGTTYTIRSVAEDVERTAWLLDVDEVVAQVPTPEELQERLEALQKARALGVTQTRLADGRFLIYRTDAEMAAVIADLERQLAAAEGAPVHTIRISASKGLET